MTHRFALFAKIAALSEASDVELRFHSAPCFPIPDAVLGATKERAEFESKKRSVPRRRSR